MFGTECQTLSDLLMAEPAEAKEEFSLPHLRIWGYLWIFIESSGRLLEVLSSLNVGILLNCSVLRVKSLMEFG